MSLDLYIGKEESYNITHNLGPMASAAGIYSVLWRPEEHGYTKAQDIIPALETGLRKLKAKPDEYKKKYNPTNGWGTYEGFVKFVENVLDACHRNPGADLHANR